MKKLKYLLIALAMTGFAAAAYADGYDLTFKSLSELATTTATAVTGDFTLRWVAADNHFEKVSAIALRNRAEIVICGDGTTINNNTIYYGPSQVPAANGPRTCDVTAAGSATEATADEPAFKAQAFQVTGMDCLTVNPGTGGVSFTLRSAAAATVPSVTCSVASGDTSCSTNIATTTAVASGATIAIAAASTANMGSMAFACTVHVVY